MNFYQQARERSSSLCVELISDAKLDVAFFSCDQLAEIAYLSVQESNLNLIEVYGDNRSNFLGHPVLPFSKLSATKADAVIVCVYDKQHPAIQFLDKMKLNMVKWIF